MVTEFRQADYNPDELAMEVIEEIVGRVTAGFALDGERAKLLAADRAAFKRYAAAGSGPAFADSPDLPEAERDWRDWGENKGVVVWDDGYAGYTYVGTVAERDAYFEEEEED